MRNGFMGSPFCVVVAAGGTPLRRRTPLAAGPLGLAHPAIRIGDQDPNLIHQFVHIGTQRVHCGVQIGFGRRLLIGRQRPDGATGPSGAGTLHIRMLAHAPEIATSTSMTCVYAEKRSSVPAPAGLLNWDQTAVIPIGGDR